MDGDPPMPNVCVATGGSVRRDGPVSGRPLCSGRRLELTIELATRRGPNRPSRASPCRVTPALAAGATGQMQRLCIVTRAIRSSCTGPALLSGRACRDALRCAPRDCGDYVRRPARPSWLILPGFRSTIVATARRRELPGMRGGDERSKPMTG
jgi:hypothetical protein